MKDTISLIQSIANLVCSDCGDSDCGIKPTECDRMKEAIKLLNFPEGYQDNHQKDIEHKYFTMA